MANLNKTLLIGRLTRDPEVRMFANGGKVAAFGFAVNNRKKNPQTGQYEDDPVFVDVSAFGKTADLAEQYLRKGSQAFIEGHLVLDQWTAQDGSKRSKLKVVVDSLQFLDAKPSNEQVSQARASQYEGVKAANESFEEPEVAQGNLGLQGGDLPF